MDTKHPFRFSLRTLLLAVVAVAVGTAAMVSASEWWLSAIMTATGTLLVAAILLAAFRTDSSRAFWTGFAVSGCAYMLTLNLQFDNQRMADNLLPGKLLLLTADAMHHMNVPAPAIYMPQPPSTSYMPLPTSPLSPATSNSTSPGFSQPTLAPVLQSTSEPTPAPGCGSDDPPASQTAETQSVDTSLAPDTSGTISAYPASAAVPTYVGPNAGPTLYPTISYPNDDIFYRQQRCLIIGHCLCALLFGFIGGNFAVWLRSTRDAQSKVASDPIPAQSTTS